MSEARAKILGRVNAALAPLAQRAVLPDWEKELIELRKTKPTIDLWAFFSERLKLVNGTPLEGGAALAAWLEENQWTRGYCDAAIWPTLQIFLPSPRFTVSTYFDRTWVDDFQFGISVASGGIAETGSLILTDRDSGSRLGALAPWAHIGVIRRKQIFPDLTAAVMAMPNDPNIIWVTGPSKTADIEGILIEGVHGPGRQAALLIE